MDIVEAAQARGHEVTLFNRGKNKPGLFPEGEKLRGDRDGDLTALEGRKWDAVIDPSGYVRNKQVFITQQDLQIAYQSRSF